MIVVSDAGPLIYLGAVGHLDLLRLMFGRVLVPEAVWREVVDMGEGRPGSRETRAATWLIVTPANQEAARQLQGQLDLGEAEALALAVELDADHLLIDDQAGRRLAAELGVSIVGSLGILVRAKRLGHIDAVRPVVEAMLELGFHATTDLVDTVLTLAGE